MPHLSFYGYFAKKKANFVFLNNHLPYNKTMIKNYLKVAVRYLLLQYRYSLLNLLGLTIGLTSSILILLYLFHELSFDQYHKDIDQIYRVSSDITEPDDHFRWTSTQFPLGKTLKTEFAEVEQYTRFY